MPTNRPTVERFDDWMRDQERRTGSLERRARRSRFSGSDSTSLGGSVRFSAISDDTLSGLGIRDGVTPVAGDLALITEQAARATNGIYSVSLGPWVRWAGADTSAEVSALGVVQVREGTTRGGTRWTTDFKATDILGTNSIAWLPLLDDTGWIDMTFTANWQQLANEETCAYRRKDGIVYWTGIVARIGAGGANDAWFFLPTGFRPRDTGVNDRTQQSVLTNAGMAVLYLRSDGAVYLPVVNPGAGGYVFLNDIRPYPADN
jgi:hypothetical protein